MASSLPSALKVVASLSDRPPTWHCHAGYNGRVKLVEEYAGVGALRFRERKLGDVAYRLLRYQGMAVSGLPIPGLHRIEGTVALAGLADRAALVGADVTLDLPDGRTLALTVADEHGRVLAEGHGPGRGCSCC
jgi:hypothetical protein